MSIFEELEKEMCEVCNTGLRVQDIVCKIYSGEIKPSEACNVRKRIKKAEAKAKVVIDKSKGIGYGDDKYSIGIYHGRQDACKEIKKELFGEEL
jgi:hypothetical protein